MACNKSFDTLGGPFNSTREAPRFWDHRYAGWAKRHFDKWYAWAIRSRLEPIKKKARMIKNHLPSILTYFKHQISNAVAEGLN